MNSIMCKLTQPEQTILITGGSGFIGGNLANCLSSAGHRIIILTRKRPKMVQKFANRYRLIEDLDELTADTTLDVIVNLAGEPIANGRWTKTKKQKIINSRINTTNKVIALIHRLHNKPRVLISGSAVGYYGSKLEDTELNEDAPTTNEFTHQCCDAWEKSALQAQAEGVRVCLLRTGIVLGKNGGALQQMLLPFKLGVGGRTGNGQQWMSWIHIDDLLCIITHLINNENIAGPVNCTAPIPVRNVEFAHTLASTIHRPCLFIIPAFILRLVFGEMAQALLISGQRVVPQKIQSTGYQFQFATLASALRDILG